MGRKPKLNISLNCEAYNTFCSVASDHRIVTAKLRLSLRQSKSSNTKNVRYYWSRLPAENNIKELYTVEVYNQFQALQELEDGESTDRIDNSVIMAHEEAAKKHIPVKNKVKQHVPWENDNIAGKREAAKQVLK